jgi:predicted nuclease of restriction endonuclease-like (RecB) superfamily
MKNDENEQYYYDLEKINVEWCAQNNYYDLEKINVEWSGTHLKIMSTRSWYKKNALGTKKTHSKKIDGEWKCANCHLTRSRIKQ